MANKTRGQLVSKLLHMKQGNNSNSMRHLPYKDIDDICEYLLGDKHEIERLEKAIDKACEELHKEEQIRCEQLRQQYSWAKDIKARTKDEWKEWALNDE